MDADLTVREIMTREYVGASESDGVDEVVDLMLEEGTGGVVVLRGSDPVGMLTPADALEATTGAAGAGETTVGTAMSGTVPAVRPEVPAIEAAGEMADAGVGSLLVTDGDDLVGILTERDVVTAVATIADRRGMAEPPETAEREPVTADPETVTAAETEETASGTEPEFATQSVCEICGSLTPDLQNFNGQLICADCREV